MAQVRLADKSVIVLEMKDGKPVYNTTVQPK